MPVPTTETVEIIPLPTPEEIEARRRRHASLEDKLVNLAGHLNAGEYRLIKLMDEFDEIGGWHGAGIRSFAHWLNWKLGMGSLVAREKVRVARALRILPQIAEAFSTGEISYSKVRAMTRVATPENEDLLLMIARHGTASQMEQLVRKYKKVIQANTDEYPGYRPIQFFRHYFEDDGSLVFSGRLPADQGEILVRALEAMQAQLFEEQKNTEATNEEADHKNVSAETFPVDTEFEVGEGGGPGPTRAEALVEIAEHFLAADPRDRSGLDSSDRHHVVLHINTNEHHRDHRINGEDLTYLAPGQFVNRGVARQIACDASITPVLENDKGNIISIGRRSRVVPHTIHRCPSH